MPAKKTSTLGTGTAAPKKAAIKASEAKVAKAKGAKGSSAKKTKGDKPKRLGALDAAAKVLSGSANPMRAVDLVRQMKDKGLWASPKGKTPEATLHASMIREIAAKGKASRFRKVDRGLFVLAGKGA